MYILVKFILRVHKHERFHFFLLCSVYCLMVCNFHCNDFLHPWLNVFQVTHLFIFLLWVLLILYIFLSHSVCVYKGYWFLFVDFVSCNFTKHISANRLWWSALISIYVWSCYLQTEIIWLLPSQFASLWLIFPA